MVSEYEKLRLKNIEDNKRILKELGLLNPFNPLPKVTKHAHKKRKREASVERPAKKYIISTPKTESLEGYGSVQDDSGSRRSSRRRSSRIKGEDAPDTPDIEESVRAEADDDDEDTPRRKVMPPRPMVYGRIPGVDVGTWWETRIECNHAGIHRPTVAGIHPGPEGAYSIALSGGYEDDIDLGECFTYTGEGGRDLKGTAAKPKNLRTAPQSKDQALSRGNEALVKSYDTGMELRVIRGYKLHSPFAPEEGYRYDGLYKVEKWWYTTGMAGYGVYKFALRRVADQAPPPWTLGEGADSGFVSDASSECGSSQPLKEVNNNIKKDEEPAKDSISPKKEHVKSEKNDAESKENSDEADKTEKLPEPETEAADRKKEPEEVSSGDGDSEMEVGKEVKETSTKQPTEMDAAEQADNSDENPTADEESGSTDAKSKKSTTNEQKSDNEEKVKKENVKNKSDETKDNKPVKEKKKTTGKKNEKKSEKRKSKETNKESTEAAEEEIVSPKRNVSGDSKYKKSPRVEKEEKAQPKISSFFMKK